MNDRKPKYTAVFHSQSDTMSVVDKHAQWWSSTSHLPTPWNLSGMPPPPLKVQWGCTILGLTKFLKPSVQDAMVCYGDRMRTTFSSHNDDYLSMTLSPTRIDFGMFVDAIAPEYIKAFSAYCFKVRHEMGSCGVTPSSTREDCDLRRNVPLLSPVTYLSSSLCRSAFGLSPEQMVSRFDGKIESARLFDDGVYLVGSSHPLSLEDNDALSREMTEIARGKSAR